MKIRIYVVTYDNNTILNEWLLSSLYKSNYPKDKVEVYIIDNHSNIKIKKQFKGLVTVIPNSLRLNSATGHLSRNWNEAIINGFESLTKPVCDAVICVQNDTIFNVNWYQNSINSLKNYDYIQQGIGDQFQIFTAEAIRHIGIYDERFCGIGFQEYDCFLRAILLYGERVSISDYGHSGHCLNPYNFKIIESTTSGHDRGELSTRISMTIGHAPSQCLLSRKWPVRDSTVSSFTKENVKIGCETYTTYPYFEMDIYPLTKEFLNYVT